MGRPSKGWRLSRKPGRRVWSVKFRHAGRDYELGTGEEDESIAKRRAAELYAGVVTGTVTGGRSKGSSARALAPVAASWLESLTSTLDVETVDAYTAYCDVHFVPFFTNVESITDAKLKDYVRARLGRVLAVTVRKELGALLQLAEFAGLELTRPKINSKATGTRSKHGRRGRVDLSPDEVARILAALPERRRSRGDNARLAKRGQGTCTAGHPVRARYVLMYETSLRPETLDLLSVPEHYTRGASHLTIANEIDKARFGRQLPLSARAREALDAVAPASGLIFGRFRNPRTLRNAARAAGLDESRASKLTPYDFRRARLTHLADAGQLTAAQWMAGHRRISTTAIYARGSLRAAEDALRSLDGRVE